jgi:small GTP-binding protein
MSTKDYDYEFKIAIVGDSACGKTCCLRRFLSLKRNSTDYDPFTATTIGYDLEYYHEHFGSGGDLVRITIIDTGGSERFRALIPGIYRAVVAVVIMYDITRPETFQSACVYWVPLIQKMIPTKVTILLAGNKCELNEDRKVPQLVASEFAQNNGFLFFETSAHYNINIKNAFDTLALRAYTKHKTFVGSSDVVVSVAATNEKKKEILCCK